ncbi:LacI family DNA-binding transcriptional regulator [Paenibacillus hunanensis]|uniref:LacI family sucrose operon transcriptional repressor n=1 Tax=Paenibacillus hunanensis TaxID=539262 RepID=A0ABU1J5T0_9BACL|nr:LacI family DNA-binding transcriptional regulator [Paenibacillus hunanensis]MCL9663084.1 LacI family DNA-binding transcriptional regulator [Paenibacillus hunanensis]MDR6246571.1 LacI family sucrose operon transcriptional repressor [Paenibacillus hunanensis]
MSKTIADIARIAGVAKSTVSRYLNGGSVSVATRNKIEQVIKETGYVPNTFAQSLKAKTANIIGTIVPRLDSFATSHTLMGIDDQLRNQGCRMLITNTSQDMNREIEAIYELARQKISGIILLAARITEEHLEAIQTTDIPVLLVGQQHEQIHSLIHNDYDAGYELGRYVLDRGHRRLAYLGVTEQDIAVGVRRKQGFARAVEETGECTVAYYETSFRMSDARQYALQLLQEPLDATIIVCATDNIALGVMKAAHELGIDIPAQLSITGFGGYDVTEVVHPALTTIRYPYQEAGKIAAQDIVKLVHRQHVQMVTVMDYELLQRESVDKC